MTINRNGIISSIFSGAKREVLGFINKRSREKFTQALNNMIRRIENHSISKEISQKQNINQSSFLNTRGNLFSFLGFEENSNPIDELISFIRENTRYVPATSISVSGLIGTAPAKATFPSREEFDVLGLAWEPNRSWAFAIEEGVNNLGYYLFVMRNSSRSGIGIQAKNLIRSTNFTPTPYLTPILKAFREELS